MSCIKHLVRINSPPEVVFQALTEKKGLSSWWTTETQALPQEGSTAEFKFGDRYHNKMRVVKLTPPTLVEWKCLEGDREWVGTRLLFELEESNGTTIVRFSHDAWRQETDFFASCNFNWGYYLHSLKIYCETGLGTPFTGS